VVGVEELDGQAVLGGVAGAFADLVLLDVHAAPAGDVAFGVVAWESGGAEGQGGGEDGGCELHFGWFEDLF